MCYSYSVSRRAESYANAIARRQSPGVAELGAETRARPWVSGDAGGSAVCDSYGIPGGAESYAIASARR